MAGAGMPKVKRTRAKKRAPAVRRRRPRYSSAVRLRQFRRLRSRRGRLRRKRYSRLRGFGALRNKPLREKKGNGLRQGRTPLSRRTGVLRPRGKSKFSRNQLNVRRKRGRVGRSGQPVSRRPLVTRRIPLQGVKQLRPKGSNRPFSEHATARRTAFNRAETGMRSLARLRESVQARIALSQPNLAEHAIADEKKRSQQSR